ncbi:MAG: glutamate racemase [Crenarchaeota archaeon]|nr:MAG: glutamate racemase [Thermoproteota archaeon]RDJ34381.1 MAG: glutamate racemase [Thermoproteota archaeon]RDJ34718.1 MAG: glutamate racemase [Thermoproteota archaeon]RDJ38680.1 MAG: glutamate racemase [Thermoproteota archaeon]
MNEKIVVFDSGLGSLSIIKPIQRVRKSDIIYFADNKNFPYGKKPVSELKKIIQNTISVIEKKFNPEIIIIGSNTPTLLFPEILSKKIHGVLPPLIDASRVTRTENIAILATETVVNSKKIDLFIKKQKISQSIKVFKINASPLVNLVESGKFLEDKKYCRKIIQRTLKKIILKNEIDVFTLSSTHLPFLKDILEKEFPSVKFLDPAPSIAKRLPKSNLKRNRLSIYTNGDLKKFQYTLKKINISNRVKKLEIS